MFQIASNGETTVLELATKLAKELTACGIVPPVIRYASPRIGDVKRNYSDTTKAHTRLGWHSTVSLEQGLERTIRWFLEARGS